MRKVNLRAVRPLRKLKTLAASAFSFVNSRSRKEAIRRSQRGPDKGKTNREKKKPRKMGN